MAVDKTRKRPRRAMVVVRSPTSRPDGDDERLSPRDVQMQLPSHDGHQLVVVAAPEGQDRRLAGGSHGSGSGGSSPTTDTRRLLLAHAQRARHLLSRRSSLEELSRNQRGELAAEIQRMNKVIRTLQQQVELTTRSVESMENLVFHLQQLTRSFVNAADPSARYARAPFDRRGLSRVAVGGHDAAHHVDEDEEV